METIENNGVLGYSARKVASELVRPQPVGLFFVGMRSKNLKGGKYFKSFGIEPILILIYFSSFIEWKNIQSSKLISMSWYLNVKSATW